MERCDFRFRAERSGMCAGFRASTRRDRVSRLRPMLVRESGNLDSGPCDHGTRWQPLQATQAKSAPQIEIASSVGTHDSTLADMCRLATASFRSKYNPGVH